jgi:hypothetical protein
MFIPEGGSIAKAYGIKVRCYWEHIGNKWENEKSLPQLPLSTQKKKTKLLECMMCLLNGSCMLILVLKLVISTFGLN